MLPKFGNGYVIGQLNHLVGDVGGKGMSLASRVGVVLGLVCPVGCPWQGFVVVVFYVAVFRV